MKDNQVSHPIPAVARLIDHVNLLIRALEVEVEGDTPNPIPYQIQETHRTWLIRARGVPAIEAFSAWAGDNVEKHVPDSVFSKLDEAIDHLHGLRWREAGDTLAAAGRILVTEVPKGLTLQEMARIACLSSTVSIVAELLGVYMPLDFQQQPDDTWAFIEDDADPKLIVPIVADTMRRCHLVLGGLEGTHVRTAFADSERYEHPGLLLLLWAVESGQIRDLQDAIEKRVDEETRALQSWKQGAGLRTAAC
jgi:diadenosine tetraphosphatase ApaH/serine/threonine PP2A family protein phosphatase